MNQTHLSPERLKRRAKALKKEAGMPHHAALDKAAQEVHFQSWKHFLNASDSVLLPRAAISLCWNAINQYAHSMPWEWASKHQTLKEREDKVLDDIWYVLGGRAGFFGWTVKPSPTKTKGKKPSWDTPDVWTSGLQNQPGKQVLTVPKILIHKIIDVMAEYAREAPRELIRGKIIHDIDAAIIELNSALGAGDAHPASTL